MCTGLCSRAADITNHKKSRRCGALDTPAGQSIGMCSRSNSLVVGQSPALIGIDPVAQGLHQQSLEANMYECNQDEKSNTKVVTQVQ